MGYKFGEKTHKIIIEIEGKEYPVKLNGETIEKLEKFGKTAVSMGQDDKTDFIGAENLLLDFIESILGVDETADLLNEMDDEYKNAFEYMALAEYITEQIREQGEKLGKQTAPARPVRRR